MKDRFEQRLAERASGVVHRAAPFPIGRRSLAAALAAALPAFPALACAISDPVPLPKPSGPSLLSVSGRIRCTNAHASAIFDRAMLQALGTAAITTRTPWYNGPVQFEGVPMVRLMDAVGAEGEKVTAVALNDYSMDIPLSDFTRFRVLLAMLRDGAPMPANERGPLFIVYPYDADSALRSPLYYGRSVWSVAQLIVR